jgi:hypothetical protein
VRAQALGVRLAGRGQMNSADAAVGHHHSVT